MQNESLSQVWSNQQVSERALQIFALMSTTGHSDNIRTYITLVQDDVVSEMPLRAMLRTMLAVQESRGCDVCVSVYACARVCMLVSWHALGCVSLCIYLNVRMFVRIVYTI
jgi:hypothetical protein